MKHVNILGVEVDDLSRSQALAQVRNFLEDGCQHFITTPNPEIVLAAASDSKLKEIINYSDMALPDGFGLKIAAWILGRRLRNRVAGADFAEAVVVLAEELKASIFLLGGLDESTPVQAAKALKRFCSALKIAGAASGGAVYYQSGGWRAADNDIINKINNSGARILLVGFGCPKQEKWIFSNLDKLPAVKVAMTVGGTFDYLAGSKKRAPDVVRRVGLEWLWRLVIEPRRIKRIWNATGVFLYNVIKQKFRNY